jgi:hypothetical protein
MTVAELAPTRADRIALALLAAYVTVAGAFAAGEFMAARGSSGASCPIEETCNSCFVMPDQSS